MGASTAGVLMISGSVVFFIGAAVAVPRVFTEPEPDEKSRMLAERLVWWRVGQPLYAVGALVAALSVGSLAADDETKDRTWLAASCAFLVVGALAWSWSVYQRALRPREFALGRLPGWPFVTYVGLTIAGLFLLGWGIHRGDWPDWLGATILGANAVFLVAYLRFRDIPPFVFYLLMTVVGIALL